MIIQFESVNLFVSESGPSDSEKKLVLLHGFSGSGEVFESVIDILTASGVRCLAIDLIGHGKSEKTTDPRFYSMTFQVDAINHIITTLCFTDSWLLGYSLGSRVALNYASKWGNHLIGLILESSNPGISNDLERKTRYSDDQILAKKIRSDYESFIIQWNRLPLFRSPADSNRSRMNKFIQLQRSQNPECIALSIEGMSPGITPFFSDQKLNEFDMPIEIITGETDLKYTDLWNQKSKNLPKLAHTIIEQAGHRVHLDNPSDYAEQVIRILSKYQQN